LVVKSFLQTFGSREDKRRALGHGGREIEKEEQSTLMSEHNLKLQKVFNESHAFRRLVDLQRLVTGLIDVLSKGHHGSQVLE